MPYLVEKEGFKDSASIHDTRDKAIEDGTFFWPNIPFTVREITDGEAQERIERYHKRLKAKGIPVSS